MLILSDLMFFVFWSSLIWSKTSLLLTVRNILILDTCRSEVSYLGDMLTREYCFLFLTFKTCLQRQSQHHVKKKRKNKTRQLLTDTVVVSKSLFSFTFSFCPFAAFLVSRINNLMQMVSASEAVYCVLGHWQLTTSVIFLEDLHRGCLKLWFVLGSTCPEIRSFVLSYLHLLSCWGKGMFGRGILF